MKCKNAKKVLPADLVEQIQQYVQGEYLYVPICDKTAEKETPFKVELVKRNAHIYTRYLEGLSTGQLAKAYHLSESSIRRIVIKQRKGFEKMSNNIMSVLENWNLHEQKLTQIYDTVWQAGEEYVLKVYHQEEMLQRNLKILQALNTQQVPVGKIIPTSGGQLYVAHDDTFYFLAEKLKGSNIVQMNHISFIGRLMGETIANLHIALKKCEEVGGFWENSLLDEANGWIKTNFEKGQWRYLSKETYEEVVAKLQTTYDQLPVQLIHRDVHFGNFLFDKGKFSGYIDFDLSQRNIRIFDICYFLLGLLSEEEKLQLTGQKWFEFLKYTFEGYESIQRLEESEKQAVPYVMECIELLFVAYFDGIEDTCCAQNAFELYEFVQKREEKILREIK